MTTKFKVGDKVRVKASITDPRFSWGAVSPGDIGTVSRVGSGFCNFIVDFKSQIGWRGVPEEMELATEEPVLQKETVVQDKLAVAIKEQIEAIRKAKARFRDEQRKLSKLQAAQTLINSL